MKRVVFLTVIGLFLSSVLSAQEQNYPKHEIKFIYGDDLSYAIATTWLNGFLDAISGSERVSSSSGAFGVGFRHRWNRVRAGLDLMYLNGKTDIKLDRNRDVIDLKSQDHFLSVLPTFECNYWERGPFRLYGSASVGLNFGASTYEGITEAGKDYIGDDPETINTNLAFQLNPIGMRIGSPVVGGFVEFGYGMKGFVNLGLSFGF